MGAGKSKPNQPSFFDRIRNKFLGYNKPEPSVEPFEKPQETESRKDQIIREEQSKRAEENFVMKYVIFKNLSRLTAVVFPQNLAHDSINIGYDWKPVAAGFYNTLHKTCFGESIGLNLSSTEYDEVVIRCSSRIVEGYFQRELSDLGDVHYKSVIDDSDDVLLC